MSSSTKSSLGDGKLPVFVSPPVLHFYSNDQSSHKQKLILYNPYDMPVKYKVVCNASWKYSVMNKEGTIMSHSCVDIFIRHMDICINHEGVQDSFKVYIGEVGKRDIIGRREVKAVLLPSKKKERSPLPEDRLHSPPPVHRRDDAGHRRDDAGHMRDEAAGSATNTPTNAATGTQGPEKLIIFTGILCIIALMLPLEGDIVSKLPDYLHLTVNQKLIAAYILGLVTVLILRI